MPRAREPLPVGQAHLWILRTAELDLGPLLAVADTLLSSEERARCARYTVAGPRLSFVLGRGLLRTCLAGCTGIPPERIRLRVGPHGRPELDLPSGTPPLRFNLTHTRGLVACLLGRARAVGVDAEHLDRGVDHGAIARRHFAPLEVGELARLAGDPLRERFFALWTLKESYLKARGEGLSLGLSRVPFRLDPIRLEADPDVDDNPLAWQFALLRPTPRHLLAVSLRREGQPDLELVVRECRSFAGG